ncbi:MAG: ATP-binding protein [Candidatus Peribacteria bacterium]|nr:MAG: ATP-binding protein [Candidatus Peribacteria bacterium]
MLDNLVSNAVKFSLAPVHLRIELSEESLSVEDFGVGIEAKNLEKIWEKFYRNDTGKEGFGIGLFLVQRLVKLYGWEITVQSEAGKGTTFTIHFSA